jgi:lambda family phage tail tape measure protein
MATSTIRIVADSSQAERAINRLQGVIGNLQTALAGVVSVSLYNNLLRIADGMQDVADSTGIAIPTILGFSEAVRASGGNAEAAQKGILRLVSTIGDAADGSASAQNAFASVGVSLKDLRTLSEQDILKKVVAGLGQITDKAAQAQAKTALFGKEFRAVAVEDLAKRLDEAAGAAGKYSSSVTAAADASESIEKHTTKFNLVLLQIIEPLNKFIASIDLSTEAIRRLIGLVGAIAAVVINLIPGFGLLTRAIVTFSGSITAMLSYLPDIEKYYNKLKDLMGIKPSAPDQSDAETKRLQEQNARLAKQKENVREVTDALAKRRAEIQKASTAFKEQNNQIIDNINLEKSFIGKTQEYIQVEKAREAILSRAANESQKLREAKAALGKDEKALAAIYDQQIAKISQAAQVDADRVGRATTGLIGLRQIEAARLQDIENTTKAIEDQIARQGQLGDLLRGINDQQRDAEFESAQQKRSPFERQMESIRESARKAALEAGRAFADTFEDSGDGLSVEKANELAAGLDAIAQRYSKIAETQLVNLDYSRTFASGWKDAFDQYVENATNSANIARSAFQSLTSNMEQALDNFVMTGKLNFKDLTRNIIQDLLKIQLRAAAVRVFSAMSGSLLGFAKGGYISTNKPVLVGENGPEVISGAAGMTVTPNSQLNNSTGNVTNNYYSISAVDSRSVAQLFSENRMTLLGTVRQAEKELPFRGR